MISTTLFKRGNFLVSLILIQLVAFNLAQITFTREWVAGKRSFLPSITNSGVDEEEGRGCSAVRPVIEFLFEYKKVVEEICGWKIGNSNQNKMVFVPTSSANMWREKDKKGKMNVRGGSEE